MNELPSNIKPADISFQQAENHFRSLIEAMPTALFVIDEMGKIMMANQPALSLLGYSGEELSGTVVERVIPQRFHKTHMLHRKKFNTHPMKRVMGEGQELYALHRSGREIPVEIGLNPLKTKEGIFTLASILDVTERKANDLFRQRMLEISQAALEASTPAEIIERTMEILRLSVPFDYCGMRLVDREKQILRFVTSVGSAGVKRITTNWEIPLGKGISGYVALSGVAECVNNSLSDPRTIYPPGFSTEFEYTICLPLVAEGKTFGTILVIRYTDHPFTPEEFELTKVYLSQVTLAVYNAHLRQLEHERNEFLETVVANRTGELRHAISHIQQQNERLALLHHTTMDLLHEMIPDELHQVIASRATQILNASVGYLALAEGELLYDRAIFPQDFPYQLWKEGYPRDQSPVWQVFDSGEMIVTPNLSLLPNIKPETAALGIQAGIFLPIMARENCLGVLGVVRMEPDTPFESEDIRFGELYSRLAGLILDNVYLREKLRQEAIRDPLTGLFNRRFMQEALALEIQRAQRSHHELSVVMLDLDHFKHFNDTFGHDGGDEALRVLGKILKAKFRGSDIACRYGGEEFTLILPETTLESAKTRLEDLRQEVSRMEIEYQDQLLGRLTISIGIASFPYDGKTDEILLKKADQALYRAKNAGRNRVELAISINKP